MGEPARGKRERGRGRGNNKSRNRGSTIGRGEGENVGEIGGSEADLTIGRAKELDNRTPYSRKAKGSTT